MAPTVDHNQALEELITSTRALITQFNASLNPNTSTPAVANSIENPPNPLTVLRDSAKLLKAHTTKLSLLSINKPFTASAVHKVLKELSGTCLPAMMSAVQLCEQEKATWGSFMGRETQLRVRRVFKDLETLLEEVRSVAQGNAPRKRDSLNSTGVVWESCDALVELEKLGISGLAVQKAEQYRDTIKDAIEELHEWKEGEDLDSEGHDGLLDSDDEAVDGDGIEDIFNAANSMPKDRPELGKLVEEAESRLKKVALLYNALIKRRLKTFKAQTGEEQDGTSNIERLDETMGCARRIPHQIDELASRFYDLNEEGAREQLDKCVSEAKRAAKAVELNWIGGEDEFTVWTGKWKDAIGG